VARRALVSIAARLAWKAGRVEPDAPLAVSSTGRYASTRLGRARQVSLRPEPADVAKLSRRLLGALIRAARKDSSPAFTELLAAHLGPEAAWLPVVGTSWPAFEHINVQLALEHWLAAPERLFDEVGVSQYRHQDFSIGDLAQGINYGPVPSSSTRVQLAAGPNGELHDCARCAIYLVEAPEGRAALLFREAEPHGPAGPTVRLEVLAPTAEQADRILREVGQLALEHNVFRGHVLAFGSEMFGPRRGRSASCPVPPSAAQSSSCPTGCSS
jgi:hypothetical protein